MTLFPIVERELRLAARKFGAFRLRTVIAVLTTLVAMVTVLFASVPKAQQGSTLFQFLVALAFFLCLFEGIRGAADCVSEEKREGTSGLLFLTDLRGYDVVLGKLAAVSVRSFQALFAFGLLRSRECAKKSRGLTWSFRSLSAR